MKKATIYDYIRMCRKITKCNDCPFYGLFIEDKYSYYSDCIENY